MEKLTEEHCRRYWLFVYTLRRHKPTTMEKRDFIKSTLKPFMDDPALPPVLRARTAAAIAESFRRAG